MARPAKPKKSAASESLLTGRVTRSHGRHHFVQGPDGALYEAHRRGRKGDVVVGDMVRYSEPSGGVVAIEEVLPRTSLLFRSDEWRTKELASNIDLVAIVFASRPTFNPWFIWKALLAATKAGITPIVIRNKTDLEEGREEADAALRQLEALGYETLSIPAGSKPEEAKPILETRFAHHKTLFVGQSGMGKSTILNLLIPDAGARTREFSEALDLGKQTTTVTCWYDYGEDGAIVDSPGFQEFGLEHLDFDDVILGMPDIRQYVTGCRYFNCRHLNEPQCGVKDAVARGDIDPKRYEFYRDTVERILKRPKY